MSSFTYTCLPSFPEVSRNPSDILKLFSPESQPFQLQVQSVLGAKRNYLGCDLEFSGGEDRKEKPTITGVSDGALTVSVPWEDGLPYFRELVSKSNPVFVGHSFVGADAVVFRESGLPIDLINIEDTIIWHWLVNMHLCKGTGKTEDGDGEKRGKGYMNLWAFCSLYTSLGNWKDCRGEDMGCDGSIPCEKHSVFQYNGVDSFAALVALPHVVKVARIRGVDKLYPMHRELMYVLTEISRYGIQTDQDHIQTLRDTLVTDKERIASSLSFSPTSPKQILDHFNAKGITLEDTTEATIREAAEEYDNDELHTLLEYKELGNGPDRWFGERFVDSNGRVHPRLSLFTSSGRLMCSSPNFQNLGHWRVSRSKCKCGHNKDAHKNVTSKGDTGCSECEKCLLFKGENIGGKVRRGVIASQGTYLAKFDLKNGEGRVMFHFSGYEVPEDMHTYTAGTMKLSPDMEYCLREGGPRQAAKKIVHASSYLEGIQLKTPAELRSSRIRSEISSGARVVYPNWTFNGKIVTFTGANFAERVYGAKSFQNRKRALDLLEGVYFKAFPKVRDFQQSICTKCEREKMVRTPLGYATLSYGQDEERMKTTAAIYGSQPVGHLSKLALLNAWRAFESGRPMRPILQEHDSILYEVRDDIPPDQAGRWMQEDSDIEMKEIPGLRIPVDMEVCLAKNGEPSNWKDSEKLVFA